MSRTRLAIFAGVLIAIGFFVWANYFRVDLKNYPPSGGTQIIAFGDSLTSGVGAGRGEDYPSHLSQLIGRDVVNRGIPGETTAHALRRLEEDVLEQDPRIVIVFLGGNDMLQRRPLSELFGNLDQIVERIQESGAMVVLVGLKGLPFDQGYGAGYRDLARRRGCLLVPDAMGGIITDVKLKSDQVHPNGKGYRLIAERVAEALEPYLGES